MSEVISDLFCAITNVTNEYDNLYMEQKTEEDRCWCKNALDICSHLEELANELVDLEEMWDMWKKEWSDYMTNGDRIRQMSNEELTEWLDKLFGVDIPCKICAYDNKTCEYECIEGIKAYLDAEVKE